MGDDNSGVPWAWGVAGGRGGTTTLATACWGEGSVGEGLAPGTTWNTFPTWNTWDPLLSLALGTRRLSLGITWNIKKKIFLLTSNEKS